MEDSHSLKRRIFVLTNFNEIMKLCVLSLAQQRITERKNYLQLNLHGNTLANVISIRTET